MKVLIIEDEKIAADKIESIIRSLINDVEIMDSIATIDDSVNFLKTHSPDLIFMDIELADGTSFEIFNLVRINCPVIFTTAYDKYAIKAFEVNSIDYLLKPITEEGVQKALKNYNEMREVFSHDYLKSVLGNLKSKITQEHKTSFLVKSGDSLLPIKCSDIAYFFASDKWTYLITHNNNRYILNYTLAQLEELINPADFRRINRSFLVNKESIQRLEPYLKGQVAVFISPDPKETIIVSRKRTPVLKSWLGM